MGIDEKNVIGFDKILGFDKKRKIVEYKESRENEREKEMDMENIDGVKE